MNYSQFLGCLGLSIIAASASAEPLENPSLNMFGSVGLIDMPSAESQLDGQLSVSTSRFAGTQKTTLSFQITPRLSGSFRYSVINDWTGPSGPYGGHTADRSFDLRYLLVKEGEIMPAVAIGLRDFIGTGIYAGEYIVATKNVTPSLKVTAGLGWGRLSDSLEVHGSSGGFGGTVNYDQWFRGPVGGFGGIEWKTPVKHLTFKAEYSSDQYVPETVSAARPAPIFDRKSDFNFGLEYSRWKGLNIGVYSLYGSEIGFRLTTSFNPKRPVVKETALHAPLPVVRRDPAGASDLSWLKTPGINARGRDHLNKLLNKDGMSVEALALFENSAELRLRNNTFNTTSQAIGRAARAMAFVMPDSVDTFVITPMANGIPASSITIRRADVENLEFHPQGQELSFKRAVIRGADPLPANAEYSPGLYPDFEWAVVPYVVFSLFDPVEPVRADVGLRATGKWSVSSGLSFSASVIGKLAGNIGGDVPGPSSGNLARVRSDVGKYYDDGNPAIERLTADFLFKPGSDLYARFSAGYLETMFAGVSAELLWKPAQQNWGVGAEINYVQQRDFDQLLGLQDYNVVTGHVSAYVELKNGFSTQLDVGRYLAGDYGATLSVDRVFDNGWRVGAYATRTSASYEDFGEGSFDKGIRMTIPLTWAIGNASRKEFNMDLNSLSRDGGARLNVANRLYPMVRDYHQPDLESGWGRFWR